MTAVGNGTWVTGISRHDRTSSVARRTLRGRLDAVQRRLPLAAEEASRDIEHVHQLRVATRRAVAAVRMYQDLLPRRTVKRVQKQLKEIRSAAGKARDLDVLLTSKAAGELGEDSVILRQLQASRIQAQQPIVDVYSRLRDTSALKNAIELVLSELKERGGTSQRNRKHFAQWARSRLHTKVERFFKAEPKDWQDLDALHRFRIRAKELRYTMELLAGAFPKKFRRRLYPQVEAVQERLGEINDHFTAMNRFQRWRDSAGETQDQDRFDLLRATRQDDLERSRQRFVDWWTGGRRKKLRRHFRELLQR